ncbi:saccharopine dehydrogenase family protein [Micromonospora mirobrigensis]|uniref:Saccharopine dehydrogenase, NADP-dependent n=1 Tax=Micromonospora mirobrigensis TaxID=262898 RepID=A0A1C5AKY1_9ACTN|nr:saccharopine dehydrogenase NADP-binding domain-containing protein [Micromonospora mirobrigensis]SCF45892.1 Saccharopine dehydrogenase, NADP-dependent [Micromonospora mirobrigensis]
MKVLVLGAGTVGSAVVDGLVSRGHDRVTVADRDGASLERITGTHPVSALRLDVTDTDALTGALEPVDIVISTVGPFYRFGTTVLEAAIQSRTHYVDVADDPMPTLELLALHDRAAAAGIAAVVGAGASPGLSNILAVLAARRLDTVHRIVTAWPEDPVEDIAALGPASSAATVHWVHQFAHPVPALRGGTIVSVAPLTPVPLAIPGVGLVQGSLVGHPEAVTMQRAFPELLDSTNCMLMRPGDVSILHEVADAVARGASEEEGAALLRASFMAPALDRGPEPAVMTLLALAEGVRDGRPASSVAMLRALRDRGMGPITALPAVVTAELVIRSPRVGVHPPEVAVEPELLLGGLLRHVPGADTVDQLVSVLDEPSA